MLSRSNRTNSHLILVEDASHVLVEPVKLVSDGVGELLNLGLGDLASCRPLLSHPRRRADGKTRSSGGHDQWSLRPQGGRVI